MLLSITIEGGKGLICNHSDVTIVSCLFKGNMGYDGGAVSVSDNSNVTLDGNVFVGNKAMHHGGAIYAVTSSLILMEILGNTFTQNSAQLGGGALFFKDSRIGIMNITAAVYNTQHIMEDCTKAVQHFSRNEAEYGAAISMLNSVAILRGTTVKFQSNSATSFGGAIFSNGTNLTSSVKQLHFTGNRAQISGGAFYGDNSSLMLGEDETDTNYFAENHVGSQGGAINFHHGTLILTGSSYFINNYASQSGGGIASSSNVVMMTSTNFINNTAYEAGGMAFFGDNVAYYNNINFTGNSGGAIWIIDTIASFSDIRFKYNFGITGGGVFGSTSSVFFSGSTLFEGNTATDECGGAISIVYDTRLFFRGSTTFSNNRADCGGAIRVVIKTEVVISGQCLFVNNTADRYGGGIFASDSNIALSGKVNFTSNKARYGGAMYFVNGAILTLKQNVTATTSSNHADVHGGAIFNSDSISPIQCNYSMSENTTIYTLNLPSCFMKLEGFRFHYNGSHPFYTINSANDTAGSDGSFMFGGLLDKCQIPYPDLSDQHGWGIKWALLYEAIMKLPVLKIQRGTNTTKPIASETYILCFCDSSEKYNCTKQMNITAYRGRKFRVSLLALSQGDSTTSTSVSSILSPTARLELNQSVQALPQKCTDLGYNLYSTEEYDQLILYPNSTCRDTGLASAVVNVKFHSCPKAFTLSGDQCVCEKRLQEYTSKCKIYDGDGEIFILRKAGQKFWVSTYYWNRSYQGLILYHACPVEYCKKNDVNITTDKPDIQCGQNRSGVLCGSCASNYSLLLGGSRCEACSNVYLALLPVFAAAGIVLVVFLSSLRITVATGMINTIILYANIVQANRILFLPSSTNVLTVFIAWMNLDLGFKTCFYQGMNAYVQTWLQFAFPIYVWILISLIIVASRHSVFLTKLIGSNPIAVLATLLLMSYTKILKIVIEVYSFGELDYPDNKTVTVWLKDANVPFLQTWHLFLTMVTSLFLIFLFLPYTFFLLLGYKLYRFSDRRHFRWFNRFKPLLDSYYAPYEKHTRFWPGFLLLIRCMLYIIFSFDSQLATTRSIIITFTAVIWLSVRIHKEFYINAIEASVYLNLIILAVFETNSPVLVHPLVSVVFVTMVGIIMYHFHLLYIAKSELWQRTTTRIRFFVETYIHHSADKTTETTPLLVPTNTSSHDPHKILTKTIIHLREPLLDSN